MEEIKAQVLHDIHCLDLKEEIVGFNEEECQQRLSLRDEFRERFIKRRSNESNNLQFNGWKMGIETQSISMG